MLRAYAGRLDRNHYHDSQGLGHWFQFKFEKSTHVYFKELFRTDLPSVHQPPLRSAEDSVALVFRNRRENAGARRIGVQPLDDASLLVIVGVQADMTIAESLSDDDGSLLRVEVALAGLARRQRAADSGAISTR